MLVVSATDDTVGPTLVLVAEKSVAEGLARVVCVEVSVVRVVSVTTVLRKVGAFVTEISTLLPMLSKPFCGIGVDTKTGCRSTIGRIRMTMTKRGSSDCARTVGASKAPIRRARNMAEGGPEGRCLASEKTAA